MVQCAFEGELELESGPETESELCCYPSPSAVSVCEGRGVGTFGSAPFARSVETICL